jgi:hypothetical protein
VSELTPEQAAFERGFKLGVEFGRRETYPPPHSTVMPEINTGWPVRCSKCGIQPPPTSGCGALGCPFVSYMVR